MSETEDGPHDAAAADTHEHLDHHSEGSVESSVDGDGDSETDSDDNEDDDEEPALKYERLGGQAAAILAKDNASTITFHDEKLVRSFSSGS